MVVVGQLRRRESTVTIAAAARRLEATMTGFVGLASRTLHLDPPVVCVIGSRPIEET